MTIKSSFSCPVEEASGAVYDMVVLFSYETWFFFPARTVFPCLRVFNEAAMFVRRVSGI